MPCTYDDPPSKQSYHQCKEKEYKKKLDKTTRLLCLLMSKLETTPEYEQWPKLTGSEYRELQSWWEKHKHMDAKRIAREKAVKEKEKKIKALSKKLTPEEIKLIKEHL